MTELVGIQAVFDGYVVYTQNGKVLVDDLTINGNQIGTRYSFQMMADDYEFEQTDGNIRFHFCVEDNSET